MLSVSTANVTISDNVVAGTPKGYLISNLDPTFNSTFNNEIYDPNFLPGFESGLTNTSITWSSGEGYGRLGYSIGPWAHEQVALPHFAVGPQCCNFNEVPHTQQFRRVEWGDYYYVKTGFATPGVNIENYTTNFSAPAYVGLRTDWNWSVQMSLDWKPPELMNSHNEWGAIGITVTQFVPGVKGSLVHSLVNLWMDENSSGTVASPLDKNGERVVPPNLVVYHPIQITGEGNKTVTINISPYIADTLQALGLQPPLGQSPVISYVYLNVEGYNFAWNTTLWSFKVFGQPTSSTNADSTLRIIEGGSVAAVAVTLVFLDWRDASLRLKGRKSTGQ